MNISRIISLVCIICGGAVAVYAQAEEQQNTYLLIGGIVLLMIGVYSISRNIPSKCDKQEEESFIKSEPEDDN
jgi:putative Mn2+ efflux pump MntP